MSRLTEYHCGVAVIKDKNKLKDAMQKLANYEDLEEQGLLLKLPCKVGDVVYCLRKCVPTEYHTMTCDKWLETDNKIIPARVVGIRKIKGGNFIKIALKGKCLVKRSWDNDYMTDENYEYCNYSLQLSSIGKTIFLTKEEAEKALEEMEKSNGRSE